MNEQGYKIWVTFEGNETLVNLNGAVFFNFPDPNREIARLIKKYNKQIISKQDKKILFSYLLEKGPSRAHGYYHREFLRDLGYHFPERADMLNEQIEDSYTQRGELK